MARAGSTVDPGSSPIDMVRSRDASTWPFGAVEDGARMAANVEPVLEN